MRTRGLLVFVSILIGAVSCKNEPYDPAEYAVIGLIDHGSGATLTFRYRDQSLYTFLSRTPADTLANMKFNFQEGVLQSIVSDSTETSEKFTTFYDWGTSVVTDSTFIIEGIVSTFSSARVVTYDGDGNPVSVNVKTQTDAGLIEELAELTWDGGNVIHLVTSELTTGEKVVKTDVAIAHDTEKCVYMKRPEYVYTLPLTELYWLSTNNPVSFNYGTGEKEYKFWYNKLGYPSNFQSDTGVIFGVSYTQVR